MTSSIQQTHIKNKVTQKLLLETTANGTFQQKGSPTEYKTFVIQKYIENPFLMNKRKFDIRVWVLLNQDMDLYFFREGYLRMSSADYTNANLNDDYIHLTNNAIQKNCPLYGKQEDGN